MTRRRPRPLRLLALVGALALALPGCNGYARRGAKGPATTAPKNVAVGAGLHGEDSTTTSPRANGVGPTTSSRTSATRSTPPASNRAVNVDPTGLRFTFTVGNKTSFAANEDFPLEVTIKNTTSKPLTYEPNQPKNFVIGHRPGETGPEWYDSDCDPRNKGGGSPALQLAPGQELNLSALYPGPPGAKNRELCRRSPGSYVAGSLFVLCDKLNADDSCDPSGYHYARSLGISITIG